MLRNIRRNNTDNLLFSHYKSPIKRNFRRAIKRYDNNNLNIQNSNRINDSIYFNNSKNTRNHNTSLSVKNTFNNSFYNLICKNCYNKRINLNNIKNDLEKPSRKEKLSLTFNEINPYFFNDKINGIHKNNINNKVMQRENLSKQVINSLEEYRKNNPSKKENLQFKNEFSINEFYGNNNLKDPRYEIVKKKYDLKEQIISQQKNIYNYNEPRKAIKQYYNKTMYEIPLMEPKYELSKECKQNYIKELKNQIINKENHEKNAKKIQLNAEIKANEDFNEYLNKKNYSDYLNKIEQRNRLRDYNDKILNLKKEKEEEEKINNRDYERKLNEKINKEKEEEFYNNTVKKIQNIKQMNNWYNDAKKENEKKKREEKEEKNKWKNYSEEIEIKCQHGNNIFKCSICNRVLPRNKLIRVRNNFINKNNYN